MRKRKIGKYTLSPRVPSEAVHRSMSVVEFYRGIQEFSERYLVGTVTIEAEKVADGMITVCPLFSAYAIKLATEYGSFTGPVRISVCESQDRFRLTVNFANALEIEEVADVSAALRRAGFTVNASDSCILTEAPIDKCAVAQVYNSPRNLFVNELYAIFFM